MTTLAASGPGSLRSALETPRPRLVVFEVAGVIDLAGRTLVVRHPHLVVAGQTAPDPGITLIRGGLIVETHHVVIQHLAARPGDGRPSPATEWAPDALGVRRGKNGPVHDVVFEHCSATWSVDENLSTSGPADADPASDPEITAHDITIRRCLIAEALSESTHPKGEHSKGTLVHDGVRGVVIEETLYAHNRERNPRLKGGTSATMRDSLIYNWGSAAVGIGVRGDEQMLRPAEATLIGNLAIAGPDTRGKVFVKGLDPGGRVWLRGNVIVDAKGGAMKMTDENVVVVEDEGGRRDAARPAGEDAGAPTTADRNAAVPAAGSQASRLRAVRVLQTAGSRPAKRDPIDARIVRSVIAGDGKIIDSQEEVGGYPVRTPVTRTLIVPESAAARQQWLDELSAALAVDASIDAAPLVRRLNVSGAAPSRGSRK